MSGRRCPICGRPAIEAARPFCSRRCADVDLSRWLKGAYRIPGEAADDPAQPDEEGRLDRGPQTP